MKLHITFSRVHKLVGLVVGVQVLLWVSGGVVMSFFDIERVRGEHLMAAPAIEMLAPADLPPAIAAFAGHRKVRSVTLARRLDHSLAEIVFQSGEQALFDLRTNTLLPSFDADGARLIALADYAGEAEILSVELVERDPPQEYRSSLPVWRVDMADTEGTRLYVSPTTGRVVARRNDVWRLYDFFWMLHIMDYDAREDFNHPLLIGAALSAFFLALSGLCLFFWRLRRRDFSWILPRR